MNKPIEQQALDWIAEIGFDGVRGTAQGEQFSHSEAEKLLLETKIIEIVDRSKIGGDFISYGPGDKFQEVYKELCKATKKILQKY